MVKLFNILVLKQKQRLSTNAEAMVLLKNLLQNLDYRDLYVIASFVLCDLLIDELLIWSEPDVIRELDEILQKLSEYGEKNNVLPLKIKVKIIRSKIYLIDLEVNKALIELNESLEICTIKGFHSLVQDIERDRKYLLNNLEKWKSLYDQSAPIRERIKQSNIQDYIKVISMRL